MVTWRLPRFFVPGVVLFTAASGLSFVVSHSREAPHELIRTRVTVLEVRADVVDVEILTDSIRRETCPAEIYRLFSNEATKEVVYQTIMAGRIPAAGVEITVPFRMSLPRDRFPDGFYAYSVYAMNICAKDKIVLAAPPRALFEVRGK